MGEISKSYLEKLASQAWIDNWRSWKAHLLSNALILGGSSLAAWLLGRWREVSFSMFLALIGLVAGAVMIFMYHLFAAPFHIYKDQCSEIEKRDLRISEMERKLAELTAIKTPVRDWGFDGIINYVEAKIGKTLNLQRIASLIEQGAVDGKLTVWARKNTDAPYKQLPKSLFSEHKLSLVLLDIARRLDSSGVESPVHVGVARRGDDILREKFVYIDPMFWSHEIIELLTEAVNQETQ